jgi:hypothetical protein
MTSAWCSKSPHLTLLHAGALPIDKKLDTKSTLPDCGKARDIPGHSKTSCDMWKNRSTQREQSHL